MENRIKIEDLKKMPYTEFISFAHQWNIPPGSFVTLNEWAIFSRINKDSRILEIASTTGFSSREIARITGCSAVGIDMCSSSVERAQFNHQLYAKKLDLEYSCMDAGDVNSGKNFTHIILGAALGFFENPEKMINNLKELLEDDGMILVSPYYLKGDKLPKDLIEKTKKVIEINPTNFDYYEAIKPYENFEVLYENRKEIIPETEEQMEKYSRDTINTACKFHNITDEEIIEYMYQRMYEIKNICNELHKYFGYSVIVLRYRKNIYPNRYVELF